jgi:hypothetical protein
MPEAMATVRLSEVTLLKILNEISPELTEPEIYRMAQKLGIASVLSRITTRPHSSNSLGAVVAALMDWDELASLTAPQSISTSMEWLALGEQQYEDTRNLSCAARHVLLFSNAAQLVEKLKTFTTEDLTVLVTASALVDLSCNLDYDNSRFKQITTRGAILFSACSYLRL